MAIKYRRNINCLTADHLHDLREAYQALYDMEESEGESFATLAGIHGLPNPSWCDHGAPGFLTWHRAYMWAFEKALRCVRPGLTLPFWDWSSGPTTGVPAACSSPTYVNRAGDTVPNPLYSGPISSAAGGGWTNRRADIDTTSFAAMATSAQAAMSSATFASFQNALNGPHGSVHVTVGGHMGSVARAGFDPIFYLHHANVDRLWWNWQRANPGIPLPAAEAAHALDPFNQPFSADWYVGADMTSTDALGYRYSNWCFWIPPILVWEVATVKLDPWLRGRLRSARVVLQSSRMPMESVEFRVFVNQPRASHRTKADENPSFAGSAGAFGMGAEEMEMRSRSTSFDLEIDVTDAVREAMEDDAEELKLKIVAVDADGEPVERERLPVDEVALVVE
jgi:hypothetical protein